MHVDCQQKWTAKNLCTRHYRQMYYRSSEAKRKQYYANNRERILEYGKNYREDNKQRRAIQARQYRQDNKEVISQKQRQRRANNKEIYNGYVATRRARQRNATIENLPTDYFKIILKFYDNQCGLCSTTDRLTLDHVIPLSEGGTHSMSNFGILCLSCNSIKNNKVVKDYRKQIYSEESESDIKDR